ncbi:nucleolar protein 9 [Ceratina calcarata]|uniref:Nucleolar protein 9 n=1 Tax=Ceratina calcarata TaxID=156304 RepID=A0AAJ7JIM0_9HYME|nr:nucleolar protein 9 [Ceratina calcarata]
MMNDHGNDERGRKRKKKRSRIQMAKKFARKRNYDSDVDSDTYQYMVHVLELMKNDFPTGKERSVFVNNVYEQTVGHEVEYAKNQVGSRILDSLLKYASLETIQRLTDAFNASLRPLCSDRFASHVLQKILLVCADRGNGTEVSESERCRYNDAALKLSRYLINNVEEFAFDTYANHLLRTVFECLGGLIDRPENVDRKKMIFSDRRPVTQEYKELLSRACNVLYNWPRFIEFGQDELTSGLLQSVLYSAKDALPEVAEAYIDKITSTCFQPGKNQEPSNVFDAECSTRLLEACLAVAAPKSFSKIRENYFSGQLKRLSLAVGTNFSVQRLLDHCTMKEDFEEILEELRTCFSEIIDKGHTGVLVSVANTCLRLRAQQGAFLTDLLKALHCESNDRQVRMANCMAGLKTYEQLENSRKENVDAKTSINLHGSLVIQAVLRFNKPIKLVNSLLEMEEEDFVRLLEDPKGSRIVDAFMDSEFIGEKSREKLGKKLKGHWSRLARSTHGSRCLDRIWEWARTNQRILIMEELAAAGESMRSTKSGQIISNKLNVPLFARSQKDWTEAQGREKKTKALFADVIQGGGGGGGSKKRADK